MATPNKIQLTILIFNFLDVNYIKYLLSTFSLINLSKSWFNLGKVGEKEVEKFV